MFSIISGNKKLTTSNFKLIQQQSFVYRCENKAYVIIYPDGGKAEYTPPEIDLEAVKKIEINHSIVIGHENNI